VSIYAMFSLETCETCSAPLCRECGEHPVRVERDVYPGWPEGGWQCDCGWALGDLQAG